MMTRPHTVGVVGATGVLGRHVLPRLIEHGFRVRAVSRQLHATRWLHGLGVQVFRGDILRASSLLPALDGCDSVLHLATAIPRAGTPGDWRLNDRIRREGTSNLLHACRQTGATHYVQQSIAMLLARGDDLWTDEDGTLNPTRSTASALDMEAMVRNSGLEWCILRGGMFYGPGTRSDQWRQQAHNGNLRLPGNGGDYISLIHVADMAAAIVLAAVRCIRHAVFCVVDDEPVTYLDLFNYLSATTGETRPVPGGPPLQPSFRVSNKRFRQAHTWRPIYPTYRAGLA